MTIEVRQMLIRTQVSNQPSPQRAQEQLTPCDMERLRAEILQECKAWLREQLNASRER